MPTLRSKLSGTGVAMVSPFLKNGAIDFRSLERLTEHIIRGKCEYLVPLGTTGESATLDDQEKRDLLDCIIHVNKGRLPVVIGLGGNNTMEVVHELERFDFKGVDAILSVSPYYNKPNQSGIINHYKTLAKASPLPLLLYNVPGRTGSNMTAATTLELAAYSSQIAGIKEASGSPEQVMQIIANCPDDFLVISGDDSLTLPMIAAGAKGVISVMANAYPRMYSDMVRLCLKGDFSKARPLHYKLLPLNPLLFAEGSPPGIKYALRRLEITEEHVRLPLAGISKNLAKQITGFCRSIN